MLLLLVKNKVYILFYSAPLALPWPSSTAEFFQFFGHSTPQILNIASNHRAVLIRWYNKRIFIKGYSVPREFSGIENYKLFWWLCKFNLNLIQRDTVNYTSFNNKVLSITLNQDEFEYIGTTFTCVKISILPKVFRQPIFLV